MNAQEAPFIFNLQTADFQAVKVQGQITFRVANPEAIAEILNFNLKKDGVSYLSEDPLKYCSERGTKYQAARCVCY